MTSHLTEDHLVALLQGTLTGDARDEAKRHLAACAPCADALRRHAALDAVLWEARHAVVERPAAAVPPGPVAGPSRLPRRGHGRSWAGVAFVVAAGTAIGYASSAGVAPASAGASLGDLLAWQNVVFYLPLAVGLLLILGSVFGVHDHDAGHDAGHDTGAGGHHGAGQTGEDHDGHGSLFARAFALLGVGRVPLTVVLMIASLYFGGLGIICNTLLSSAGLPPSFYGPISLAVALAGTLALSGATTRLIQRRFPTIESYPISRHDFAGCGGTLLLPADGSSGYAQVKDREGNVHNIRCRTMQGALPKGAAILVVEYDEDSKMFTIDANPESPGH